MSDQNAQAAAGSQTGLQIPPSLREKYPELTTLILGSESMNDEERQYWFDILPIMSIEQIEQLQTILSNEKKQLADIDAKYAKEVSSLSDTRALHTLSEKRKEQLEKRSSKEREVREEEEKIADDILHEAEDA